MLRRKAILGVTIALAFFAALAAAPRASAGDPDRLAQLKISVWPEYDKPSVLVLLDGTLADKTGLPRQVALLIPAGATLLVTTWENADGSFAPEQPNNSTDLGDGYARVTFTISQPKYRVEYYHDLLRGAPDKTMDFVFKLLAPADQVTLDIQQPLKATNFSVTPPTQSARTDADGFKYFTNQYSNVAAGQTIAAQVKYTKTDPNPSAQNLPQPTPRPTAAPAPAPASSTNNLFLLVGLVALGLVAVLGFFIWQQRARPARAVVGAASHERRRDRRHGGASAPTISAFCTQCGKPMGPDDNFCPKCGTKRRVV